MDSGKMSAGHHGVSTFICRVQARMRMRRSEAALDTGHIPPVNPHKSIPVKSFRFRLFLLAVFLLVFPFFLRRRPRVERRTTILAPPSAIFPLLNDLRNWPLWSAWAGDEDMHLAYGDTVSGAGAEQRWQGRRMAGVMRILKIEPNERIDYEVSINDGAYQIIGRIDLQPDGACTRLVWKCAWDRAENPYRRYFDLLLRWMIRRDFARGLANLKVLIERAEAPEEMFT